MYNEFAPTATGLSGEVQIHVDMPYTDVTDNVYIYRSTSPDGPWTIVHTEPVPGNHPQPWSFDWLDAGVTYSIPYYYKIALSTPPAWEYMQVVSATPTDLPPASPPAAPSSLVASDVPNDNGWHVRLTWNPTTVFTHVYRRIYSLPQTQEPDPFHYIGCSSSDWFEDIERHAWTDLRIPLESVQRYHALRSSDRDGVEHRRCSADKGPYANC